MLPSNRRMRKPDGVLIEDLSRHFKDRWVVRRRMWAMGWPGKGGKSFSPKEIWQLLCFHYAAIGAREFADVRTNLPDATGYEAIPDPYAIGPPSYRKLAPAPNARVRPACSRSCWQPSRSTAQSRPTVCTSIPPGAAASGRSDRPRMNEVSGRCRRTRLRHTGHPRP